MRADSMGKAGVQLAPDPTTPSAFSFSNKTLFRIHGWLGLNFGLILFVTCFSGAIAALSHEIDWLLNPAIRAWPQPGGKTWTDWHASVEKRYKDVRIASIHAPLNRYFAAEVHVRDLDGTTRRVYVNPYTAEVQGSTSYFNVQRFFRSFHMELFIPRVGLFFVSSLGFVLLFSIVSGILFYKNWRRHLFQFRLRSGRRALWGDVHRLLGVWALLFSAVIGITGVWYLVEHALGTTGHSVYIPPPKLSTARLAAHALSPAPRPVGEYVSAATRAIPGLSVRTVGLPAEPDDPVYVDGQSGAWFVRDRANKVFLDPYSAEVVHIQRAVDLSPLYRWVDTADPLHFGDFWGVPTKLLWSMLGMTLPIATLTGAYLSLRRTKSHPSEAPAWTRSMSRGWLGIPWANWLTIALIMWAVLAGAAAISEYMPQRNSIKHAVSSKAVLGPWVVEALLESPTGDEAVRTALWLRIRGVEGQANFRTLKVDGATREIEPAGKFRRFPLQPGIQRVLVSAEDWRGRAHAAEFELSNGPFTESALSGSWKERFASVGALIFIVAFCAIALGVIATGVLVFRRQMS